MSHLSRYKNQFLRLPKLKVLVPILAAVCIVGMVPAAVAAQSTITSHNFVEASFCNYPKTNGKEPLKQNPIILCLNDVVGVLSAGIGIVVVGVVIVGGIQYMVAGDNATAVAAAKKRIINGLVALAAFMLMFGFLQWLIPGGIFG